MRFLSDELFALSQLYKVMPDDSECFVNGSRLDPKAKGGDIDLIVLSPLNSSERWDLSISLALEFKKYVDEKIDISVVPFENKNRDEAFIFTHSKKRPLKEVLEAPRLDHACVLVQNLQKSIDFCQKFGFGNEKIESFEKEGTRESYIGQYGRLGRLLLVEAVGEGPYLKALKKRGPGLHHICFSAINANKLERIFLNQGWEKKETNIPGTVWLSKEGAGLIEIHEKMHELISPRQAVIEALSLPFQCLPLVSENESVEEAFLSVPSSYKFSQATSHSFVINGHQVSVESIICPKDGPDIQTI